MNTHTRSYNDARTRVWVWVFTAEKIKRTVACAWEKCYAKNRHTAIRKKLKVTFLTAFGTFDKQIPNYRSIWILQKQRTLAARSVQTNVPRAIHTYTDRLQLSRVATSDRNTNICSWQLNKSFYTLFHTASNLTIYTTIKSWISIVFQANKTKFRLYCYFLATLFSAIASCPLTQIDR